MWCRQLEFRQIWIVVRSGSISLSFSSSIYLFHAPFEREMRTDSTLCRAVTANRSIEASKLFNIRQRKYRTEKEKKKKKHTQHLNDSLNIAHVCCSCWLPPPHHCYFIDSNSKITHASSIAPTKLSIVSQNRRNTTTTNQMGKKQQRSTHYHITNSLIVH